jgi:hypothetical protein
MAEVEGEYMELLAIDDHYLSVIAEQVVGCARDCDAFVKETHFETPQILFSTAIGGSNESLHGNAALHRIQQGFFNFGAVDTEDEDLNALPGASQCAHDRLDTVVRLNQ